jgi:hypothetical protein
MSCSPKHISTDADTAFQVAVTGFGLVSMFFYCLLGASTSCRLDLILRGEY